MVAGLLVFRTHPFLAATHRVEARVLVVEGWVHDYTIRWAAEEFKAGSYERAFTTGGPRPGENTQRSDYYTLASYGARRLKASGVPDECVQMVPSPVSGRDRTYSSALALRDWFREHKVDVHSFNILTEDAHARRTRLLFEKAFGSEVRIGVIAITNPEYDPKHWWRYSEGVREVLGEAIAYVYARVFFHPSAEKTKMTFKQTMLLGIFPAVLFAVWFFKIARAQHKNLWWAFLVGGVSAYGGSLLAVGLIRSSGLFGLLGGFPLVTALLAGCLAGGALVAASVRANLYADEEPTKFDILAVWVIVAGSVLVPLFFCL